MPSTISNATPVLHQQQHAYSLGLKSNSPPQKLTIKDINENVVETQYAVRGSIPMRAEELERQLEANPESLPFDRIIYANIGNPQQLRQKPLTFPRQVLSLLQLPNLLDLDIKQLSQGGIFRKDAIIRAKELIKQIGPSIGAYSASQGVPGVQKSVAEFITRRDNGEPANPNDIFLTSGASAGATMLLSLLCKGPETGVLIPIPQYPLYTATLTLQNSTALPYYLNEDDNWSTDVAEIQDVVEKAIRNGTKPTAIVVINPGNPTGSVLTEESIAKILEIAATYGIVVIADEVYQENVFPGNEFYSMKSVLRSLQKQDPLTYANVQLASLHSTSKGVIGECGQRGGYMELTGFSDELRKMILKLASISICPVVSGQALVDLMVCPPKIGDESYLQDQEEKKTINKSFQVRSARIFEMFNSLQGMSCQRPQGAMYLFPKLDLPPKAIQAAKDLSLPPDEFYCKCLLEATGICTVPGSGFGQMDGTYHLRTTFLVPGLSWLDKWESFHRNFWAKYQD